MSFMDGFILRAGESSRERNMLDIQNKIAKHKAFTDHVQKISEDPSYTPDAQEAAKRRWAEAMSTDPLKFKKYDISDILTITNPRQVGVPSAPQGERPSILPSGSEGRSLYEGWEKTLPGNPGERYKTMMEGYTPETPYYPSSSSLPRQFGDIFMYTPKQDTGYDPATRSGKWTPEEAAYLSAQEKALADELSYQRTFGYRKGLLKPSTTLQNKAKVPGAELIANGYTTTAAGSPIRPGFVYLTGGDPTTNQLVIGEAEAPRLPSGPTVYDPTTNTYYPTRYNAASNAYVAPELPQGTSPLISTRDRTIALNIGGKVETYKYPVDSLGNMIRDADGAVNLTPVIEPSAYAPSTSTNLELRDFENERRWVQTERTTDREPTPISLVPNWQQGTMNLMGVPVKISGQPIRAEYRDPVTRQLVPPGEAPGGGGQNIQGISPTGESVIPTAPQGQPSGEVPLGVAPNQPTPPPPTAPTAITPGREPAGGRTIQEQYKSRLQPISYNPKQDAYWQQRPNLDLSSDPGDFKRNAIHNPALVPAPMVFDASTLPESALRNPSIPMGRKHMLRKASMEEVLAKRAEEEAYVAKVQENRRKNQGRAGIITPDSGPIPKGIKPMTELQMQATGLHINTLSTTVDLLGQLTQPDALNVVEKFSNRLRVAVANDDSLFARVASGVLEPVDFLTDEEEKKLLYNVAAVRRNLTEHIQVIRTPLGAAGFRSLEAFFALQAQYGDIFVSPKITEIVVRNTMKTVLTIRAAYARSLNLNRRLQVDKDGNPLTGPNYPDAKTRQEYIIAYGDNYAAAQAMLRDGYVAPPPQAGAQ